MPEIQLLEVEQRYLSGCKEQRRTIGAIHMTAKRLQQIAEKARALRKAVQKNQISESLTLAGEIEALAVEFGKWLEEKK